MLRSGNPALKESTFLDLGSGAVVTRDGESMTLNGTVNKTGPAAGAGGDHGAPSPGTSVAATAAGISPNYPMLPDRRRDRRPGRSRWSTIFKKTWAPVTAPLYALFEGLFLGAISAMFEARFPGIVMQAVVLTFGTLVALLMAYRTGLIKATENFKLGVVAATGGIALLYLVTIVLGLFGIDDPASSTNRADRHRLQPVRGRDRGAEPGARLRLHRERASSRARRSTWSGTARSACWSRWSGCTSRSCACCRSCATDAHDRSTPRKKKRRRWRGFFLTSPGRRGVRRGCAIALANDIVLPSPPRSGVSESLASSVAMIAARRRSAFSAMPRWSSICAAPQQQRARVGDALAGDVRRRAVHGFEDRRVGADVRARRQAQAADQAGAQVGDDVAEQVGGDDDVELLRLHHQLHAGSCRRSSRCTGCRDTRAATSRAIFRNRPEVDFRMLALCTTVTFLRPVRRARSKA